MLSGVSYVSHFSLSVGEFLHSSTHGVLLYQEWINRLRAHFCGFSSVPFFSLCTTNRFPLYIGNGGAHGITPSIRIYIGMNGYSFLPWSVLKRGCDFDGITPSLFIP